MGLMPITCEQYNPTSYLEGLRLESKFIDCLCWEFMLMLLPFGRVYELSGNFMDTPLH
jgi:hypothetical protein